MNVNVPNSPMVCECTAYRSQTGLFISGTLVTHVLAYSETHEYLICLSLFSSFFLMFSTYSLRMMLSAENHEAQDTIFIGDQSHVVLSGLCQ